MSKERKRYELDSPKKSVALPIEILTHIFRFVRISDLAVLSLVCRKWYQAIQDPCLWNEARICIFAKEDLFSKVLLDALKRKRVKHIVFRPHARGSQIQHVCKCLGHGLTSLTVTDCGEVERTVFETIHATCAQLKFLTLSNCRGLGAKNARKNVLDGIVFPHLDELNVNGTGHFQNVLLTRLSSVCPKITKLHLSGSKNLFSSFSGKWQTLSAVCSKLKVLDLTRSDVNDDQLKELVELPYLSLKELNLTACQGITDRGIDCLAQAQTYIEVLRINCVDISDKAVITISKHLKFLRWLDLNSCRQVTSTGLQFIKLLLNTMEHINLYSCYQITSAGFTKCFSELKEQVGSHPLSSLILNGCAGVTDDVVSKIAWNFKYLRELDVGSCFSVTDGSMKALTNTALLLESLRVSWCSKITDEGLLGACADNRSLICGIRKLKKLQQLDLSHCSSITDKGLHGVYGLLSLTSLNVMMCNKITDATLFGLAEYNKPLAHLNLCGCNITDDGLIQLSEKLGGLQTLDLSKCDSLTTRGVLELAKQCRTLTYINLTLCSQISEQNLPSLEVYLPLLSKSPFRNLGLSAKGLPT